MSELNPNAELWVKELESGKHKQSKGYLQNTLGYCCLGVACKVYERETGKILPRDEDGHFDGAVIFGEFSDVEKWLGLTNEMGRYGTTSLVNLNDFNGFTFPQIAEVIRSKPEGLFL